MLDWTSRSYWPSSVRWCWRPPGRLRSTKPNDGRLPSARTWSEFWTIRAVLAVALSAIAASVVVIRMRSAATPMGRTRILREGILAFAAVLAVLCLVDAGRISLKRSELRRRIVQDYPDASYAHIVRGEDRQSTAIGRPFELEFDDAITGRHVSMKDLRGKLVVIDIGAIGGFEMKRLYDEYHKMGVEFIGVDQDPPDEDGGSAALKSRLAAQEITWPQLFEPRPVGPVIRTGAAWNDFAESWGITLIPTVFIVDTEGRLYSTNARGKLATLIPKLLRK